MLHKLFTILLISLLCSWEQSYAFAPEHWQSSSKLASGKWVKIAVGQSGVYKLSFDDLRKAGFSNPDKVKVYGYGGAMLSEKLSTDRHDDLPEVSIYKELGADGVFGAGDYILFVAQGPRSIEWNASSRSYIHRNNPYSTRGYYFLSESDGKAKEITQASSSSNPTTRLSRFDDIIVHENDLKNITNTGREFYGEDFSYNTSQSFELTIPGIIDLSPRVRVDFIALASSSTSLKVAVNSVDAISTTMPQKSSDSYEKARAVNSVGSFTPSESGIYTTTVTYGRRGDVNVHLNYLRFEVKRELRSYGSYTHFRSSEHEGENISWEVGNISGRHQVWDITDRTSPVSLSKASGSNNLFVSQLSPSKEFLLVDPSGSFPSPEVIGSVSNQNLHSITQTDMVILTPEEFFSPAERVANIHAQMDGLNVTIVTPEAIFNEFSSGTPDATAIRLFMKMFYDRAQDELERPRYLLILGSGTYDNRGLVGGKNSALSNRVLTYQSENSLSETSSYVTDDYFGFLDDNEGANLSADNIDLGIGRIPARSRLEAETAVDKIEQYIANNERGSWKSNLLFVADDGDNNLHMRDADALTQYIESSHPDFAVNKVYLDAFKKEQSATGGTYPDAKRKMFDQLKKGVLMVNLTGHGNTTSWTAEQMVTMQDISNLYINRLPLWVTATCDFSRFDDYTSSAGEAILFHPQGGGIALFSTTRIVYSGPNYTLNSNFVRKIFTKDSQGYRLTLGDVMRESKRAIGSDRNKLSFMLLGDPALKLAYPEFTAKIRSINGAEISTKADTLKALGQVVIEGDILDHDGSLATWFDGSLELTLFDCAEKVTTMDNDGTGTPFIFTDRSKLLFVGKDEVNQGKFRIEFTMSKDISYSTDLARINVYATDKEGNEAQGVYSNVIVNGTADNIKVEDNGPEILQMYLNEEGFISGDRVNETPLLVVELEDETGINMSQAAIGHEMVVTIDNNPSKSYVVNSYFRPETGNSRRGFVRFAIPELESGDHSLSFKAWDVFNNSNSRTINFKVESGLKPELAQIYFNANTPDNLPRVGGESIDFYVIHNRPEAMVDVTIEVYDLVGRVVWRGSRKGVSEDTKSFPITWNLRSSAGGGVRAGAYIYKAYISTESSRSVSEAKKMIIVAQ
ncbi:MAG: type IX secretion system sortase PorU [Bacteroidales bacterium]